MGLKSVRMFTEELLHDAPIEVELTSADYPNLQNFDYPILVRVRGIGVSGKGGTAYILVQDRHNPQQAFSDMLRLYISPTVLNNKGVIFGLPTSAGRNLKISLVNLSGKFTADIVYEAIP